MRLIREITSEEENFRTVPNGPFVTFKRDPVQPEPIGTIVLIPHRIVGYDPDCDGSLMARLELVSHGEEFDPVDDEILNAPKEVAARYAGVSTNHGLYPDSGFVVTPDELKEMFEAAAAKGGK